MNRIDSDSGAEENELQRSISMWRFLQFAAAAAGLAIFFCLVFYPSAGLLLFWNILIPAAPLLLVLEAGLWRNLCPLATIHLLPRHLNLSKRKKMSVPLQGKLQLVAILAFYLIVPLRHPLYDTNAMATVALLLGAAMIGAGMGFVYDWKSGWCSSLCPVHPIEKLYGGNTLMPLRNAHCDLCVKCTSPCPDSSPNVHPAMGHKTVYHKLSSILTIGGLPGFIWAWFQVPDQVSIINREVLFAAYKLPLTGMAGTLLLYLLLEKLLPKKYDRVLIKCFAAAAVSCYYWFKLPGILAALSTYLPYGASVWSDSFYAEAIAVLSCVFFFWWLVLRPSKHNSWVIRPAYESKR